MSVNPLRLAMHRAAAMALLGAALSLGATAWAGPVPSTQADGALWALVRVDDPTPVQSAAASTATVASPAGLFELGSLTLPSSAWSPFSGSTIGADDSSTTPVPYALLGGLLIIAGLIARRLGAGQRGLSKKT